MKILFLSTANSCRSILCEAVFNHLAPQGMKASSAGSQPKGEVHPLSLQMLENAGISTGGLFSKPGGLTFRSTTELNKRSRRLLKPLWSRSTPVLKPSWLYHSPN